MCLALESLWPRLHRISMDRSVPLKRFFVFFSVALCSFVSLYVLLCRVVSCLVCYRSGKPDGTKLNYSSDYIVTCRRWDRLNISTTLFSTVWPTKTSPPLGQRQPWRHLALFNLWHCYYYVQCVKTHNQLSMTAASIKKIIIIMIIIIIIIIIIIFIIIMIEVTTIVIIIILRRRRKQTTTTIIQLIYCLSSSWVTI